jgi:hypothetical protein
MTEHTAHTLQRLTASTTALLHVESSPYCAAFRQNWRTGLQKVVQLCYLMRCRHTGHTRPENWTNDGASCLRSHLATLAMRQATVVHSQRLSCLQTQPSLQRDYHNGTNGERYFGWLKGKLIRNLEPNCVPVIDNASYQSTLWDKHQHRIQTRKRQKR